MFKKEEKTGHTETALGMLAVATTQPIISQFVTQGALGVLPFFEVVVTTQQATNLGLFVAGAVYFIARQVIKARG